jgi:hypothetical protein
MTVDRQTDRQTDRHTDTQVKLFDPDALQWESERQS